MLSSLPLAATDIDNVSLNTSDGMLLLLSAVIAVIMFGIALEMKVDDFRAVAHMPKAMAVGVAAQFICLPAITFGLTMLLDFRASIALGMILVACCPPGNISNILVYRARGNVALSLSMTALSNFLAIFLMPLNIAFWAGMHPEASQILKDIDVSAVELLLDIVVLIGIPLCLGLLISSHKPEIAKKVQPLVKKFSMIFLVLFILGALVSNISAFVNHIALVAVAVFIHDTLALLLGYGIAASFKVSEPNRRAITFEVGVRNAALGLGIALSVFEGLGGVAMVAAWWGVWDLMAGLALSSWWAKKPTGDVKESTLEAAGGA
ncbi:MAG: bile acid:sodium symporter family protein [Solirubrobacterales bacterium]|mgnify:CR=1 FL=1|nr:bile acid:sodium symporter family protein [Solirubrobacterales bacterium]HMT04149.1 bile acid:sodium symporter family protein [Solirubrobacterales bacterium]